MHTYTCTRANFIYAISARGHYVVSNAMYVDIARSTNGKSTQKSSLGFYKNTPLPSNCMYIYSVYLDVKRGPETTQISQHRQQLSVLVRAHCLLRVRLTCVASLDDELEGDVVRRCL